jgi:hypothetical protein
VVGVVRVQVVQQRVAMVMGQLVLAVVLLLLAG